MKAIGFASGWPRLVGRLGLMLLFPLALGCGPATGKVSGTVLLNGKPLPGGRVTFRPADPKRNSVFADLDEQGHYEAVLPAGEVQVSVDNRELEPREAAPRTQFLPEGLSPEVRKQLRGAAPPSQAPPEKSPNAPEKMPGKYVPIPDKYYTIEKSGLKFTVRSGDQKQDIELTW
jgi:hypothetical protein